MKRKVISLPPPPVKIGGGRHPIEADAPAARILMVDDHPPNLMALDAILDPLGQELLHAHSGEEALRQLLETDFALILMDVQMPGLDGIQTAKMIKERPRNRHIPIIFLTAIHKDPAYIFRGYKEGAVDYLLKPFDPEILRAKVSVFVDLWRKTELLRRQEAMLRATEVIAVEKRGELRFRALTDSMPQCVWAARADGEIYYCNRVWREYAGEEAGITFFDAIPEEEMEEARLAVGSAIRSGQPLEREQRLRRKDGQWRWHLCRLVPERDERGRILGFICTATDIDQHKRIEEANKALLASESEARRQAEIANRTKDEFLATVSHELRTPLNAILGWTRMLRTGAVEPKALGRVLETIERNARAQTQLVEDILDVSRIIAGKLRINIRKTDLHAVARAALDSVRPAADAKGVLLVADLQPGSAEFCGDPDRLQQVIWNLLSNSIKFTQRSGKVELRIERVQSDVRISVADTGVGIARDALDHVFDRFWQADSSSTRSQGGLGLGLAIVRHLVEVHGGTVRAESEGENQGARFTVSMPVRAVAPEVEPEAARSGAEPVARRGTLVSAETLLAGVDVLVVDDEIDARDLVAAVLGKCGASVRLASTVDEAIARIRERRPNVLLSDIGLPGDDGYELIRRVHEIDPAIPAAALTAYATPQDVRRAIEAGFQAHVAKPVEPSDLGLLVASLSGRIVAPPTVEPAEPQASAG
ncbi:MAG: response regulator [Deltaproteobacteria bacterium]|nr:MAG: response regulator [Deltaproteobacteria bacterium]